MTGRPSRGTGAASTMLREIIEQAAVKILERQEHQAKNKAGQTRARTRKTAARKADRLL